VNYSGFGSLRAIGATGRSEIGAPTAGETGGHTLSALKLLSNGQSFVTSDQ
jgi:hypothetical protein